ncbi:MAG TPA: ATP-dependent metallopeptidase FtsH/Yme1/Tma family protein, partial [Thermoanaerobaculia bacterium]|nr:ATP-dependent metallopeptidase FtsH/Yme1/Tma family protein [Thermoanaerobaculia bacterium]
MAIFVVVILLWNTFQGGKSAQQELTFTQFMEKVEQRKVAEVTIRNQQVTGKFRDAGEAGQEFKTQVPPQYD